MVATWGPAAASSYYTSASGYYADSGRPGVWYAPSSDVGAKDKESVDPSLFGNLCAGLDQRGHALVPPAALRADRTPAFDITLSAPRSVSLVWAFADGAMRRRIEHVQAQAVRATLDILAREAVFGRRGKGGATIEAVSLTAACFTHFDSRPAQHEDGRYFADPNLHTHAVALNLATRPDGTVGALHGKLLRDHKMAAGAIYHAALATGMEQLGFAIDRVGRNGIFEVAGVAEEVIQYFSARRSEIAKELAERGTVSANAPELAAAVTRQTRQAKQSLDASAQAAVWAEAGHAVGLDVKGFTEALLAPKGGPATIKGELLLRQRLGALPAQLTQRQSVIERRELVRAVAAAYVGTGLPVGGTHTELERLLKNGVFVRIGADAIGLPRYSTSEVVALERDVLALAQRLASTQEHGLDKADIVRRCHGAGLSREQTAAALSATEDCGIAIIEGAPGSGKTTTLAPIVSAYKGAGYRVVGAASAWRIAHALHDDLGIEARANASLLACLDNGREVLDARTVVVVDEAGLVGVRDMHQLLTRVSDAGAKLVLVGDRRQLQAIGSGSGLALVAHAVEAARVDTIVRQHDVWAREAVQSFGAGDATAGLQAFSDRGFLVEAEGARAAIGTLVDRWMADRAVQPQITSLLLAKTNAQARELALEVRQRLIAFGLLTGPEVTFDASTPSGHSYCMSLMAGDRFRFLARNDQLGVINGTVGEVVRVTERLDLQRADRRAIQIEALVNGRTVIFDPRDLADTKGRVRLGSAWSSTIYSAQGLTVDRAYVLLDPRYDRHDIHVAASRAREQTLLVADAKAIDNELLAEVALGNRQGRQHKASDRIAYLAARLSRSSARISTVDVMRMAQASVARSAVSPKAEAHHER